MSTTAPMVSATKAAMRDAAAKFLVQFPEQDVAKKLVAGTPLIEPQAPVVATAPGGPAPADDLVIQTVPLVDQAPAEGTAPPAAGTSTPRAPQSTPGDAQTPAPQDTPGDTQTSAPPAAPETPAPEPSKPPEPDAEASPPAPGPGEQGSQTDALP
jgi:hypothetical protein